MTFEETHLVEKPFFWVSARLISFYYVLTTDCSPPPPISAVSAFMNEYLTGIKGSGSDIKDGKLINTL